MSTTDGPSLADGFPPAVGAAAEPVMVHFAVSPSAISQVAPTKLFCVSSTLRPEIFLTQYVLLWVSVATMAISPAALGVAATSLHTAVPSCDLTLKRLLPTCFKISLPLVRFVVVTRTCGMITLRRALAPDVRTTVSVVVPIVPVAAVAVPDV